MFGPILSHADAPDNKDEADDSHDDVENSAKLRLVKLSEEESPAVFFLI